MRDRRQILLSEIQQIVDQYRRQVPGRRKAWPNAIKQRVADLRELGLSFKAISEETGVPYYTVLGWRRPHGTFHQVATVQESQVGTVTVPTVANTVAATPRAYVAATVTVTTPQGYRIDGLTLEQIVAFLERAQ